MFELVGRNIFVKGTHITFLQRTVVLSHADGSVGTYKLSDISDIYTNYDGKMVVVIPGNWYNFVFETQISTEA